MKVPELPEKPVDGFTIEWWTFDAVDSYSPGPERHLAIYIENMTWKAFVKDPRYKTYHSYSESDPKEGAAFIDNWIMVNQSERGMQFDGRCEGWKWVVERRGSISGVESAKQRWAEAYATSKEAFVAFKEHVAQFIARKEKQVIEAREALFQVTMAFDPYSVFQIGTRVRLKPGQGKSQEEAVISSYITGIDGGVVLDRRIEGLQKWNMDALQVVR